MQKLPVAHGCRLFVSAAEPSADLHGAGVVSALLERAPGVRCTGLGGGRMAEAGARLTARMESLTTMGFTQVLRTLPAHLRLLRTMQRTFVLERPDLVLLLDYPGFHLRAARAAARRRIPVLYYIAPQLWAWGEGRVRSLREAVTHLAVILPFEAPFFQARGIPTTFVGHPLLDLPRPTASAARATLGIGPATPALALFPGSRRSEVQRHWPLLRDAAELVRRDVPEVEVLVASVPGLAYPGGESFRLINGERPAASVVAAADAAICKSGTCTLEAALADTPTVVCYRTDAASFAIARRVVTCSHIGLVNLVAGREVVPEYVQADATSGALARRALRLLDGDGVEATHQRAGFAAVRRRLGTPGAARRVADLAAELMQP